MSEDMFAAIDALIADHSPLPPPAERERLRKAHGLTQDQVRQQVCTDVAPLIPCDGRLYVDIESFSNFGTVSFSSPLDANGNMNALNNFQTGTACSVVLVRVFYGWTVFTPVLTPFLSNMSGDQHLLYAAAAFRNEPYTTGLSGC